MGRKRKKLKMLGMAYMSEERHAVEQAKCQESLAQAIGPNGIDTSQLKPPLGRSVTILENEVGERFVVTEHCNENLVASAVPAREFFPDGVSEITSLNELEFYPTPGEPSYQAPESIGAKQDSKHIGKSSSRATAQSKKSWKKGDDHRPSNYQSASQEPPVMTQAYQGLVARGVPRETASAILAAGAFQQTPSNQTAFKNYIGEKNAGLGKGSPLFEKVKAALVAQPPSAENYSGKPLPGWAGPIEMSGNESVSLPKLDADSFEDSPFDLPGSMSVGDLVPSFPSLGPQNGDLGGIGDFIDPISFLQGQAEQMLGGMGEKTLDSFLDGGCFPDASDLPVSFDPAQIAGNALTSLVDGAIGNLLAVTDETPAGEAILKHLASKHLDNLKALATDPSAVKDKLDKAINGPSSSANVPVAWGLPGGAPTAVQVNGRPAARLADICEMKEVPDAGPFVQGNPTVISNGMPTVGDGHLAIGLILGTVGDPKEPSTNVLMGTATVTMQAVFDEAKAAAGGGGPSAGTGEGGPAESNSAAETNSESPNDEEEAVREPTETPSPEEDDTSSSSDSAETSTAEPTQSKSDASVPSPEDLTEKKSPEELGMEGADLAREKLKEHEGDLGAAQSEIIAARRDHYDSELSDLIAERDSLSPTDKERLLDRLNDEKPFRASEVARLSTEDRDSLHDPVLTNADRYLETRKQADICGTGLAAWKAQKYDQIKAEKGTSDATDNDGRSSSPLGIGQSTADQEALKDAKEAGSAEWPNQPLTCAFQNISDIKHIPGL